MVAGTRQKTVGGTAYRHDPLYAFGKAFTEAAQNILMTENYDLFAEPVRTIRNPVIKESLREFFCNDFVNEADTCKSPEDIEDELRDVQEQFENDVDAIVENCYQSEYTPMVGMSLPIHKLILMNNVFAQSGCIQKVTALQPAFTISMERRILVTPDGREIDMFTEQNEIADAIDATVPAKQFELSLPHSEGDTDIIGELGGTVQDELSIQTVISGIYIENVYIAEGDYLPDANGWLTPGKGTVATAETAGIKNVWYHTDIHFTPNYGGPNRLERIFSKPITIKYKTDADGSVATIDDILFGSMNKNKITVTAVKGTIKKVRLAAKLSTTNAMQSTCSAKWKLDTDFVEIPEATPINTTVSPEEVKDVAAMHDANQVTKIMSITKTALSEYKDKKIKNKLDDSYGRMEIGKNGFKGEFDFARPEGYALDWVTHRQATFMDYFDDYVTRMLQVLNDNNMTVTIFGDPRIVRKLTPTEYAYTVPTQIGAVTLDYAQTIVNTKDSRVYNFVGSDKLRDTNELMVILNPRNTERICYRIYDYQMYISNEIRNSANPSLPAIHSFERWELVEYQPVQGRIQILHPSGMDN